MPKEVRKALSLRAGNTIEYEVLDAGVLVKRVEPFDGDFYRALEATLDEWPEEDDAFRDL